MKGGINIQNENRGTQNLEIILPVNSKYMGVSKKVVNHILGAGVVSLTITFF